MAIVATLMILAEIPGTASRAATLPEVIAANNPSTDEAGNPALITAGTTSAAIFELALLVKIATYIAAAE